MHLFSQKLLINIAAMLALATTTHAVEVVVMPAEGDELVFDMESYETIGDLTLHLDSMNSDEGNWILVATRGCRSGSNCAPRASSSNGYSRDTNAGARDYSYSPSEEDKKNIFYLIKTLADKNEAYLLFNKGSIESAGKKTEHIHPLKLLQIIFTDEELKVGIRNMSKRKWVWDSFRQGTADSLADEARIGNMPYAYLGVFCATVNLDEKVVKDQYVNGHWREFIDTLVNKVPRKADSRRYDF